MSVLNGAFSGVGFTLAIVLFAGIRERLETAQVPKCLEGFPISLIAASLVSLAFLGFRGCSGIDLMRDCMRRCQAEKFPEGLKW